MKLIRSLVLPWILYFLCAVAATIAISIHLPGLRLPQLRGLEKFTIPMLLEPLTFVVLGAGALLCLMANLRSLRKVGIWMAESLPESLNYGMLSWFFRALKAAAVVAIFWFVGQLPWIPLIWQAAVLPVVVAISLFVIVASLLGPILKISSQLPGTRVVSAVLSLPVLAAIPATAFWVGQSIVKADRASRPDLLIVHQVAPVIDNEENSSAETKDTKALSSETASKARPTLMESRMIAIRTAVETNASCQEHARFILASLDGTGPEDQVYWSIRALPCADTRAVVALPRLAQLSSTHPSSKVRAASILGIRRYGIENTRQVSYLLFKRLSETETPEVVEATAQVLAPLGFDAERIAVKRLRALLDSPAHSQVAAKALISNYKREEMVAEAFTENISRESEARASAVAMICLLPQGKRAIAEEHLDKIVAMIRSGDAKDPAVQALNCLGRAGFRALADEVAKPRQLERGLAAHALSQLDVKKVPEALETTDTCSRDADEKVRDWCSRSLGQIGAPALPKILDLLQSNDAKLKDAGKNALRFFDDPTAKDDLKKIRAQNSGWMANNRKLQIAQAVGTALIKLENEKAASKE